jgi:hypothetical protein
VTRNNSLKWNKRDALAVAVLIVLWALFFWRFFTPNPVNRVTFSSGDFTNQFYTFRAFAFRELRAGRIPLWIPCTFCGVPFLADSQTALAYPPVTLSLLAAVGLGLKEFPLRWLELEALLHILGAGIFTYGLLRGEVHNRLAALLGAVVYTFSGYLTGYPALQLAVLESGFWLPFGLWAARGLGRTGRLRYLVALVAALTFNVLAGHPHTFLFCFYPTLAFYAYHTWRARRRWLPALGQITLVIALTVGLSAIQLLPTAEYSRLCTRSSISYELSATGFPTQDIAQFAVTGLVSVWQPLYVGILPLALGWLGLAAGRRRDVLFWFGLAIAGLILSCGGNLFGYDLAYLFLPGFSIFRGQEHFAILVSFALSVLAAYGAEVLVRVLRRRDRERLRRTTWLMGALVLVALFFVIQVEILRNLAGAGEAAAKVSGRLAITALALLGSGFILALRRRLPRKRLIVGGLAIVVIVFDLFSNNRGLNTAPQQPPYPELPAMEAILADEGLYRIQDDYRLPGHIACYFGKHELNGISPYKPARYVQFLDRAPEAVRWKLLGVRYLVSWRGGLVTREGTEVEGEQIYQQGEVGDPDVTFAYRLANDGQRAFLIHDVRLAGDDDTLYAILSEPDFDPARSVVLFEEVPAEASPGEESVSITRYTSSQVELEAELSSAGVLVLGDTLYPGWHAYVDDRPAPIYEANGAFRAVPLDAGQHTVAFRFEPLSVYLGGGLSALTLIAFVGGLVWMAIKRRRERRRVEQ